jgi:uncharacterized cupredoxin-like copper-binding protein
VEPAVVEELGTVVVAHVASQEHLQAGVVRGEVTPLVKPGKSLNLTVTFRKKGTYRYECTIPGHAAAGMKGVFTVR